VVPRGARLYRRQQAICVSSGENGRLHRAYIKVGIANPTKIEVLSGLSEGDVVALPGEVSLKENLRIGRCVRNEAALSIRNSWYCSGVADARGFAVSRAQDCRWADAQRDYNAGRYNRAVDALNGAIAKSPNDASLHFLLGQSYYQLREFTTRAPASLERAVQLSPKNPNITTGSAKPTAGRPRRASF
jgi:tetratricopeptide (TPR) repeat protein